MDLRLLIGWMAGIVVGAVLAILLAAYAPDFVHKLGPVVWFIFSLLLGATTGLVGVLVVRWLTIKKK